jgi:Ni/Co efflux regulator RcnB
MKRLVLAVSALLMLTLPVWGQNTAHDQAKAGAAKHREEARNNPNRPHHRSKHRHHRHHNNGA